MQAKGKFRLTQEQLRKLLQLPEEIVITDSQYDSDYDTISFYFRSSEPIEDQTHKVQQGAAVPVSTHNPYKE